MSIVAQRSRAAGIPGSAPALGGGRRSASRRRRSRRRRSRRRARRAHRAARRADVFGPGRRARLPAAARSRASTSPCSSGRRTSSASTAWRSYRRGGFETPFGVARDRRGRARRDLRAASPIVREHAAAHAREHSLEMQLPFLQRVAPDAPIVPLVMGYQTAETAAALGDALAAALRGRRALLVASTDLSHYHDARHRRAARRASSSTASRASMPTGCSARSTRGRSMRAAAGRRSR